MASFAMHRPLPRVPAKFFRSTSRIGRSIPTRPQVDSQADHHRWQGVYCIGVVVGVQEFAGVAESVNRAGPRQGLVCTEKPGGCALGGVVAGRSKVLAYSRMARRRQTVHHRCPSLAGGASVRSVASAHRWVRVGRTAQPARPR
jgi:hypothetical protein